MLVVQAAGRLEHRLAGLSHAEADIGIRVAPPELPLAVVPIEHAGLEVAVLVEGKGRGAGSRDRNPFVEIAAGPKRADKAGAHVQAIEIGAEAEGAEGPLFPTVLVGGAIELRRDEELAVSAAPLAGERDALALAVIFVVEEVERIGDIGGRRSARAEAVVDDRGTAVLHALGRGPHLGKGEVGHNSELADPGLPAVAVEAGEFGRRLLRDVAVIDVEGRLDQLARRVERHAGAKVDAAGDAALDHLGGLVLVSVDAGHQLRRDVAPTQAARGVGAERVAAVEFGADLRKAADDDAGRLGGEVGRVAGRGEAVDGDSRNALKRLGDRLVGEGADVGGGDRIDDGVGVALDVGGGLQSATLAGDDDRVVSLRSGIGVGVRIGLGAERGRLIGGRLFLSQCGRRRGDHQQGRRDRGRSTTLQQSNLRRDPLIRFSHSPSPNSGRSPDPWRPLPDQPRRALRRSLPPRPVGRRPRDSRDRTADSHLDWENGSATIGG